MTKWTLEIAAGVAVGYFVFLTLMMLLEGPTDARTANVLLTIIAYSLATIALKVERRVL